MRWMLISSSHKSNVWSVKHLRLACQINYIFVGYHRTLRMAEADFFLYLVRNQSPDFVRQSPKWLYSSSWGVQEYLHRIWQQSIQLSSRYFPQNHECRHHDGAFLKSQDIKEVCWIHHLGRMNPPSNRWDISVWIWVVDRQTNIPIYPHYKNCKKH